ncbi:MAG: response regulator, partial [Thermoanaerobaculia bacterium]|nr:response regulator [Thermoanaerobaculia bacterium]
EGRARHPYVAAFKLVGTVAAVPAIVALLTTLPDGGSLEAVNFALPATLLLFASAAGLFVACTTRVRARVCSRLSGLLGVLVVAEALVLTLARVALGAVPGVSSPLHLSELVGFVALGTGLVAYAIGLWWLEVGPPVRWLPAAVFVFLCAFVGGLWHAISSLEEGKVVDGPLGLLSGVVALVGIVLAGLVALAVFLAQDSMAKLLEESTELRRSERRYRELFEERAAAALHESETRFRELFENLIEGVFQTTLDGRVTLVNPALVEILGYDSEEELLGLDVADDIYANPVDRAANVERLKRDGRVNGVEVRYRRKDGSILIGRVSARLVQDPRLHDEPVIEGSLVDITEQKRLEQQLLQSQKMEAIGQLAGGVAHDFNNLLTAIGGYAELALSLVPGDAPIRHELSEIRRASDRAAKLTRQLLAFSRQQVLNPEVIDLAELVGEMKSLLQRTLGEQIVLDTRIAADVGSVRMDPTQFEQVLLNLAVNARDAMRKGGRLVISAENARREEALEAGAGEFEEDEPMPADPAGGGYVVLRVRDEGEGMDDETRRRAIDPFFTTKAQGEGTGLGLSTVYGIVKQTGGILDIESRPEEGTEVSIFLPRTDDEAAPREAAGSVEEFERPGRRILVVEDDPQVRRLASDLLEAYGYEVHVADGADRALELCRGGLEPGLVLTDVVMPRQSGPEMVERLREIRPDCKVLFMSGYTRDQARIDGTVVGQDNYLAKPFAPADLVRKIENLLRNRPTA